MPAASMAHNHCQSASKFRHDICLFFPFVQRTDVFFSHTHTHTQTNTCTELEVWSCSLCMACSKNANTFRHINTATIMHACNHVKHTEHKQTHTHTHARTHTHTHTHTQKKRGKKTQR